MLGTIELATLVSEANAALREYAVAPNSAATDRPAVAIKNFIVQATVNGHFREAETIRAEYNRLHPFVTMRCQHVRDRESRFSIINAYPEGHKTRVAYERRVDAERAALMAFDLAETDRHLAGVDAALSRPIDITKSRDRQPVMARVLEVSL